MSAIEKTFVLTNAVGLHARPAVMLVQTAARFHAEIQLRANGRVADAKRIVQVLKLGAEHGAELYVAASGDDAPEAVAAIGELIEQQFGEMP